jgi:hypothetical protein
MGLFLFLDKAKKPAINTFQYGPAVHVSGDQVHERMKRFACLLACLFLLTCGQMLAAPPTAAADRVVLHDGWALQSACKVNAGGDAISSKGFKTQGWYRTSVQHGPGGTGGFRRVP